MIRKNMDFYVNILNLNDDKTLDTLTKNKDRFYNDNILVKKKGGLYRKIYLTPNDPFKEVQKCLYNNLLRYIPISTCAFGFVKDRSYIDYLLQHVVQNCTDKTFIRMDVSSFYDTITVKHFLADIEYFMSNSKRFNFEKNKKIIASISRIAFYKGTLPQGAVTSPVVSNIIFRKIDIRIEKYCDKSGVTYSRYADDLLFSFDRNKNKKEKLIKFIRFLLIENGFKVNKLKTKVQENEIVLNGYKINDHLSLTRSKTKELNSVIYAVRKSINTSNSLTFITNLNMILKSHTKGIVFANKYEIINYLGGHRSFLIDFVNRAEYYMNQVKHRNRISILEVLLKKINAKF